MRFALLASRVDACGTGSGNRAVSIPRYAARRDDVEPALIQLARRLGAKLLMSGPLDWWLLRGGRWIPVEIKDPAIEGRKHEFTPAQRRFFQFANAYGGTWLTWRTEADVMRDLGARLSA